MKLKTMKTSRKKLGNLGEDYACSYLERLGHTILDRNWRCGHLELDIVSLDGEGIHFVEVKSRTAPFTAHPEENVTRTKQGKITAAALGWLNTRGHPGDAEVFFDVIAVVFDGDNVEIDYFKQAYIPIYT